MAQAGFTSVEQVRAALAEQNYLAEDGLTTAVYLALTLKRPLLLEGEAGVGKTELAKVIAAMTGAELIRLQCYEASGEATNKQTNELESELYNERFLIKRALLRAIEQRDTPPVLLIDEIDRADDEFEAYLLEILSDFQVTVPELGTFKATTPPIVILTSNRTRDVHDALKRRCLYHWVDHPSFEREVAIVRMRVPQIAESLAKQVAAAVEHMRSLNLYKPPGVAETIDWATALAQLGARELNESVVSATLGTVLKYREDHDRVREQGIAQIVAQAFDRGLLHG
jgi:MoxR-like ATPase